MLPNATRQARAARAGETWQQLVPNRPGVEDLLDAKRVPVAAVDPSPEQPRRGKLEGIEELASSIAEYGLLQPIVVTPPHSGRYTCIAGHRRLAAFQRLFETHPDPGRWATIPAIERDTPDQDRVVLALLENLSRQDLSEADVITGLRLLHDLRGWSQREIARRLGVTSGWINQYFRVAGDADVSQYVQVGQLSVAKAHAVVLATSPEAKRAALDAGRQRAPLRVIRDLAKGHGREDAPTEAETSGIGPQSDVEVNAPTDRPHSDYAADSRTDRVVGGATGVVPDHASDAQTVATVAPEAGARDLADLAGELGLTVDPAELRQTRLITQAVAAGARIDLKALIQLARADLRLAESLVRATAPRRPADRR